MLISLIAPMLSGTILVASSSLMPDRSIDKMCASSLSGASDRMSELTCKKDERDARDNLKKIWTTIPLADRSACLSSIDDKAPSFVDLQSCIENIAELRKIHRPHRSDGGESRIFADR